MWDQRHANAAQVAVRGNLSFDNAFKLTLAMETADKDTHTCFSHSSQFQHKLEAEELRVQKIEPSRVDPSSRPGGRFATNPVTVVDMVYKFSRQTPVVSDTLSVTIVEKQGTLFVFAAPTYTAE